MNIARLYKPYQSKKYLRRIVVSFSVVVLLALALFSSTLYYNSESIVLDMQKEANRKVLAQIKFNVSYMNDVIQKLTTSLYYDNDVIPLMNAGGDYDVFEMLRKRSRIDQFADYTPFIHSIMIYNARQDRFLWGGDPLLQDKDAPIYESLRRMFAGGAPIPKLEMVPMSLNGGAAPDVFSIFDYESTSYEPGQSVFILNIKPQWLFDNIKLINQLAWQENENVFIFDRDGKAITPDTQSAPLDGSLKTAILDRIRDSAGGEEGMFDYSGGGAAKIVTYLDTGVNGWTLVSLQPYDTLVKKADALKNTSIALTLIFILLSLLTTLGVSHRLYRPLGRLVNAMRGGDSGGGDAASESQGGDELAYMSSVYERTMRRLQAARSEQQSTRGIVRAYHVRQLLTGGRGLPREQAEELIARQRLAISTEGPYLLCVIQLDQGPEEAGAPGERERGLLHFAVANIAQELLAERWPCEVVEMKNEHLVALVDIGGGSGPGEPPNGPAAQDDLPNVIGRIRTVVAELYRVSFSAAIGGPAADWRGLPDHYALALQLLRYKLVYGPGAVITPPMAASNMAAGDAAIPAELEKRLAEGIKARNGETFEKALSGIFRHIASCNYDSMVYMALHVAIVMKNAVKEMNDNRIVPLSTRLADVNRKLVESATLAEMERHLLEAYREIGDGAEAPEQDRNDILVETIKAIVEQSYADVNLNLQKIADVLRLSPDYIGKLFKRSAGVALAEFITDIRMRQAAFLLEQGDWTITELIERIGIGTRSNFFRLFKLKYGTTPKEYRVKRGLEADK